MINNKMAKQKNENKVEAKQEQKTSTCHDIKCPFHGELSLRGRTFKGTVIRKFPKRVAIEFERTIYLRKYERFAKSKTKLHARLPDCLANDVNVGDYIEIKECRPLSKIISFVVISKIRGAEVKQ
jgi:small subunit ribosomal protein S17